MMAVGGMASVAIPFVEIGISTSMLAFGLPLAISPVSVTK